MCDQLFDHKNVNQNSVYNIRIAYLKHNTPGMPHGLLRRRWTPGQQNWWILAPMPPRKLKLAV